MKRKTKLFFAAFLTIPVLMSCGEKKDKADDASKNNKTQTETKNQEASKPESIGSVNFSEFKVANTDKEYFKLVDGGAAEIKIDNDGFINITAELELTKKFTGKLGQYQTEQAFVSLVAQNKDGNAIKLSSTTNGEMRVSGDSEGKEFADFLRGEPGYKAKFTFMGSVSQEGSFKPDTQKTLEAAKQIAGFKVLTDN